MKKIKTLSLSATRLEALRTSAVAILVALLAGTFWFVASPEAMAQTIDPVAIEEGGDCTVCHKNQFTQVYPCASLTYRRHIAHGDEPFACPTDGSRKQ